MCGSIVVILRVWVRASQHMCYCSITCAIYPAVASMPPTQSTRGNVHFKPKIMLKIFSSNSRQLTAHRMLVSIFCKKLLPALPTATYKQHKQSWIFHTSKECQHEHLQIPTDQYVACLTVVMLLLITCLHFLCRCWPENQLFICLYTLFPRIPKMVGLCRGVSI